MYGSIRRCCRVSCLCVPVPPAAEDGDRAGRGARAAGPPWTRRLPLSLAWCLRDRCSPLCLDIAPGGEGGGTPNTNPKHSSTFKLSLKSRGKGEGRRVPVCKPLVRPKLEVKDAHIELQKSVYLLKYRMYLLGFGVYATNTQ